MKLRKYKKLKQKQTKYNLDKDEIRKIIEKTFEDFSYNTENFLNKIMKNIKDYIN